MIAIDGVIADWTDEYRLDDAQTGTPGYGLYGTSDATRFFFAITSDIEVLGAGTTLWIDTDLDRSTGYQIWGWVGGVDYKVEIGADGVPKLYSTDDLGSLTFIADLDYAYSSDGGALEFSIDRSLLGSPDQVRVFSDVNDTAFIPNSYSTANFVVGDVVADPIVAGGKILDGEIGEWTSESRLDTPETGASGYAFYGDFQDDVYTFAIESDGTAIGLGTTLWLDTDLDQSSGYLLWGWAAGAEYSVEVNGDGAVELYSVDTGGNVTFIADLDKGFSSDSSILEFSIDSAMLGGSDRLRVLADVNNSVFIPNNYSTADFIVGTPPPVVASGGKLLDGDIGEWSGDSRLDTPETGALGYAFYGDVQNDVYTFAIQTDGTAIGAGTTIWLDTDLDRSTGYQIWGWAAGAEYNVNFDSQGTAGLYSGGAGQDFVSGIDFALNDSGTILELAIDASLIGSVEALSVLADVNDSVFLPNDYALAKFVVGDIPYVVIGSTTIDGVIDSGEWIADETLVDGNYRLYGTVEELAEGNQFVLAIASDADAIGAETTIWLDTDLNSATGYQIWGWAGGAEYNINLGADGTARLYSGAAGETFVADLTATLAADGSGFEVALPGTALAGDPESIRVIADVNNSVFLPGAYAGANLVVSAPKPPVDPVDDPGLRIGIVYSETTAENYYNITNYGQLFMSAQNQAMQAGIPFDLLGEADLLDPAGLAAYDVLVFPGFSHVNAAQVDAIAASLAEAASAYGVGLIAAGNFLTNDETGAALAGDSYARMKQLLGVTLEGYGATEGLVLEATGAAHPILNDYASGQEVGGYPNTSYLNFTDVTADSNGEVLFDQVVTNGGVVERYDGVIATTTTARNVHFATDALIGNNNILGEALDWIATDNAPDVSLLMTRGSSLFYSRNDMDQAQEFYDVAFLNPGIYDAMLPIVEKWYDDWGFVGSYYIDIGADPGEGQKTNWRISAPYYEQLMALESEIGSHSYTHPEDTNLLLADTPEILALAALVDPRNPGSIRPERLTADQQDLLFSSYRFQFETSKLIIEAKLGISVAGAAVPGAPESIDTTREIIQYYDYLTGGYSGEGAGYPGAFGFLTPGETEKVYLAPNMSFDFSLIGFQGYTPEEAADIWLEEYEVITGNGTAPIIAFPWHDYGPTNWDLGEPEQYSLEMFEVLLSKAAEDGAEFVTGLDLSNRISSFADSTLEVSRAGDVISATVTSPDAGKFALDVSDEGQIASVANWYAYSATAVFLPQTGGSFEITLGATPADVTHIAELGQRADLISVSGDGTDLDFSFQGGGDTLVDLQTQGSQWITVTGADGGQLNDNADLILSFDAVAAHSVALDYSSGAGSFVGSAANEVLIGGQANDVILGNAGNDTLIGGAGNDRLAGGEGDDLLTGSTGNAGADQQEADVFVFEAGAGNDIALDFKTGVDSLEFIGLGFVDENDAYGQFAETSDGLLLSYSEGGGLLLADLDFGSFAATDIFIDPLPTV